MDVLTNIHTVTILQYVYMYQSLTKTYTILSVNYLNKDFKIHWNKPANKNMLYSQAHWA